MREIRETRYTKMAREMNPPGVLISSAHPRPKRAEKKMGGKLCAVSAVGRKSSIDLYLAERGEGEEEGEEEEEEEEGGGGGGCCGREEGGEEKRG